VFGLGTSELIILAVIGAAICLPAVIALVVIVIAAANNRPRE
jgi:hypothetical protein